MHLSLWRSTYIQMFRLQYEGSYDTIEHVLKPPLCSKTMPAKGPSNMYLPLKMHYHNILPKQKKTMSVIYGDNFLHHSQCFQIMVKGWKWDPRIWYDLLYNWPSTHKMSCKYLHADQSYDGMHLLTHRTTLYDAWKICKDFEWRPFWKFLMATITRTTWSILTFVLMCYTPGHQYTNCHANIHKVITI